MKKLLISLFLMSGINGICLPPHFDQPLYLQLLAEGCIINMERYLNHCILYPEVAPSYFPLLQDEIDTLKYIYGIDCND